MDQSTTITAHARRWSESVLELPEGADNRTLLRRLTEADYFASADDANAMQLLLSPESRSLPEDAPSAADFYGRREAVDRSLAHYAETFFDLTPVQRRQQWHSLAAEAADFPDLSDWLQRLEPALGVAKVPTTGDDRIDRFVDLCSQSFVARAPWHARQRQAIAHLYCQTPHLWEPVVQYLIGYRPAFINVVAPWIYGLQRLNLAELDKFNLISQPEATPIAWTQTTTARPKESGGRLPLIFVASIIFAVIRGIARFDPPPPRYNDNPFPTRTSRTSRHIQTDSQDEIELRKRKRLMDEDIRKILMQYEAQKLQKESIETLPDREAAPELPADALSPDQPRN